MKLNRSQKIKTLIVIIIVFISATILSVYYLLNSSKVLKSFDIISLENNYTTYTLKFEQVPAAVYYKVTVVDNHNVKIYEEKINKNEYQLDLTTLDYGIEYSIMVYAFDRDGEVRPANEPYVFTWLEPSIDVENKLILGNEDYTLKINGDLSKKNYVINVSSDGKTLVEEKLTTNEYIISSKYYKDTEKIINVSIISNKKTIDTITLYNNLNPITDLNITSPINEIMVNYSDVSLKYEGGENASEYTIKIYNENKKLIKSTTSKKKNIVLSKNLFQPSATYYVEVIAKYENYTKEASVTFVVAEKGQASPVYLSNNWKNIKKGTKLELSSATKGATIYYTTNGDDPESMGIKYREPLVINEDTLLKVVAMKDDLFSSDVLEYNIKVSKKENLKVFVSPSNQSANIGVSSVGYTNERDEMNDVADYVVERLEKHGVTVYRNNPATGINAWIKDSNYYGVDCHIAIHSNASNNHNTYGVETWVNDPTSPALSLAHQVQKNLVAIYPYKDKENADRGVKYAYEALGEVNTNFLPFGLLVEIAHHDYKDDAEWIMNNKQLIGYNIADSILKYYQIID